MHTSGFAYAKRGLAILLGTFLLTACGRQAPPGAGAAATAPPALTGSAPASLAALPRPGALPAPASRVTSAAQGYNLLNAAPLASSETAAAGSAVWSSGSLTLAPEANLASKGMAWAIFGLAGFPFDASIFPQKIESEGGGPLWVGLSDYATRRWRWLQVTSPPPGPWNKAYGQTTGFVSLGGSSYVAIVKLGQDDPFAHTFNTLTLTASGALFAQPTADIQLVSKHPTLGYDVTFDFSASASGDGNITGATFTPDTGVTPIDLGPTLPFSSAYTYSYASSGTKTASLRLIDDKGGSDTAQLAFTVASPERELLVVYNSSLPASADLASYYMDPETGRGIDPAYQLGLDVGLDENADLTRAQYETMLRDPIKSFLDASGFKDTLKYILLVKGVPHRITDANPASIDSELCLLYSDLGPGTGYPYTDWLYNGPASQAHDGRGFYATGDAGFIPNHYKVSYDPTSDMPSSGDESEFILNYLVGRLSAYTYDEAKLLVDRALAAGTSSTGWVIMDSSTADFGGNPQNVYDTMVDPVFQYPDQSTASDTSLEELLLAAGFNEFADTTTERIVNGSLSLPAAFDNRVIGYTGWGVNHAGGSWAHGSDYILQDLGWNYLPGACFMSYESYNGWNFNGTNLGNRNGQGQICDFLRMGGTCAVGNAWEPYTIGVGDERVVFDRYILHGDRWIESAYKGLWLLSWMEVVVGDPLCRVKP